jgi:hypothetical protein
MMAIDEKWEGTVKLQQEVNDSELFTERFNTVYREIAEEKGY